MITSVIVFAITYVLISSRRLGRLELERPGGALIGAIACVALGVLSPQRALEAVDERTLLLLFGMMGMGAFLAVDGFFDRAALRLAALARTPARLLGALVWSAGLLSALITNDAVCILGAPLVVGLVLRHRLAPLPFLLALATSANTGSVATLVGNPQNMLCASLGGLEYLPFLLHMAPVALVGLAINHLLLFVAFRRELAGELASEEAPVTVVSRRAAVGLAVIALTVVLYSAGLDLAWTAAGGCALLLLFWPGEPRELWQQIDWSVLLFFAALFVVVEGLVESGATALFFEHVPLQGDGLGGWARLSSIFLVGSNLVSNVPFILVVRDQMATLPDPTLGWELLAMASTFAGNLTLIGSVANIIVAEKGHALGGIGFWSHLRIGLPLTLITTAAGTAWLLAIR